MAFCNGDVSTIAFGGDAGDLGLKTTSGSELSNSLDDVDDDDGDEDKDADGIILLLLLLLSDMTEVGVNESNDTVDLGDDGSDFGSGLTTCCVDVVALNQSG